MAYCSVINCNPRNLNKKIRFFTFPQDGAVKDKWVKATGLEIIKAKDRKFI